MRNRTFYIPGVGDVPASTRLVDVSIPDGKALVWCNHVALEGSSLRPMTWSEQQQYHQLEAWRERLRQHRLSSRQVGQVINAAL